MEQTSKKWKRSLTFAWVVVFGILRGLFVAFCMRCEWLHTHTRTGQKNTYEKLTHFSLSRCFIWCGDLFFWFPRSIFFFYSSFGFASEFTLVGSDHWISRKSDQNITKMNDTFRASCSYLIHNHALQLYLLLPSVPVFISWRQKTNK